MSKKRGDFIQIPYEWFGLKKKISIQCEEIVLLACIVGLSKNNKMSCIASDDYFENLFGMSKREIRYRLGNLEKAGLVSKERRGDKRILIPNEEKIADLLTEGEEVS